MTVTSISPVSVKGWAPAGDPDVDLVAALRARDEDAFATLMHRYTSLILRMVLPYLPNRAAAEDVVQDTWIAVLRHIDRFEGRSTFKTWLLRIALNTARTRRMHEVRTVCWGALPDDAAAWQLEDPQRSAPGSPEQHALAGETWQLITRALAALPRRQREIVILRDVGGWTSEEVCAALAITPGNQRVLLHRGRSQLRELLHPYTATSEEARRLSS
jgi:RNA polymerase sigma-70 factor (ECF subfamily)